MSVSNVLGFRLHVLGVEPHGNAGLPSHAGQRVDVEGRRDQRTYGWTEPMGNGHVTTGDGIVHCDRRRERPGRARHAGSAPVDKP